MKMLRTHASSKDVSKKVTNEQHYVSNVGLEYNTELRRPLGATGVRRPSVTAILGVVIAKFSPDE